jgi:glycine dehydrogenase
VARHNSTTPEELAAMVQATGFESMDALIDATVPKSIRRSDGMDLGKYTDGMTESQFLDYFK